MYRAWFDGSVNTRKKKAFIGYIIMDEDQNVFRAFAAQVNYTANTDDIETLALNRLLTAITRSSLKKVQIYSDCLNVVTKVKNKSSKDSRYTDIMKELIQHKVTLTYVPRERNTYADQLCRYASARSSQYTVSNRHITKLMAFA